MASLRISDEFINSVKESARINFRSIGKQVEYWARIGKAAEENPDLSIDFIKNCLKGLQEIENKETTEFKFSDLA
ncbi:MAG: ParD-like family protein [Holosporales bacterium]|jgi:hypothetical protein|nr:ParD-like family protein [Holosporales bacterium]